MWQCGRSLGGLCSVLTSPSATMSEFVDPHPMQLVPGGAQSAPLDSIMPWAHDAIGASLILMY